jgi:hypothetical protein
MGPASQLRTNEKAEPAAIRAASAGMRYLPQASCSLSRQVRSRPTNRNFALAGRQQQRPLQAERHLLGLLSLAVELARDRLAHRALDHGSSSAIAYSRLERTR